MLRSSSVKISYWKLHLEQRMGSTAIPIAHRGNPCRLANITPDRSIAVRLSCVFLTKKRWYGITGYCQSKISSGIELIVRNSHPSILKMVRFLSNRVKSGYDQVSALSYAIKGIVLSFCNTVSSGNLLSDKDCAIGGSLKVSSLAFLLVVPRKGPFPNFCFPYSTLFFNTAFIDSI